MLYVQLKAAVSGIWRKCTVGHDVCLGVLLKVRAAIYQNNLHYIVFIFDIP